MTGPTSAHNKRQIKLGALSAGCQNYERVARGRTRSVRSTGSVARRDTGGVCGQHLVSPQGSERFLQEHSACERCAPSVQSQLLSVFQLFVVKQAYAIRFSVPVRHLRSRTRPVSQQDVHRVSDLNQSFYMS